MKKKFLDKIEKIGNFLPEPVTLFVIFSILIIIVSHIATKFGVQVEYNILDNGELEEKKVLARSLLTAEGLKFIVSSTMSNFTGFLPLGTIFTAMLGIGVASGSGLINAALLKFTRIIPKNLLSYFIVFLGVFSNIVSSTGLVVYVPLAALIYASFGRHPIAGITAAFAGVSGGWNANVIIGTSDPIFADISTLAARIIDRDYTVFATGNLYFMFVSAFVITFIGAYVTDNIIEPRLKPVSFKFKFDNELKNIQKKALNLSGLSLLIYFIIIFFLVFPENSLFGEIFIKNIVVFISIGFFICGSVYGIVSKSIKSDRDLVRMMDDTIATISGFLVILFFAAQFVAYFNYSNLGLILSVEGAMFLKSIGFTGVGLVVGFVIFTAFVNVFISIDAAKWAMMAPVFVPMFMQLGYSPEFTQNIYRMGDSVTNIVSPIMPYFPLILSFVRKYEPNFKQGSLLALMTPYCFSFLFGWIILLVFWIFFDLPIGFGANIRI